MPADLHVEVETFQLCAHNEVVIVLDQVLCRKRSIVHLSTAPTPAQSTSPHTMTHLLKCLKHPFEQEVSLVLVRRIVWVNVTPVCVREWGGGGGERGTINLCGIFTLNLTLRL